MTIKNPMFHNNGNNTSASGQNSDSMMSSMMRNLQTPPFVSPMDQAAAAQHASIIRNENGMYTIRNPAFQSMFSGGGGGGGNASSSASPGNGSYGNGMMPSSNGSAFMPSNSSNFMSPPPVASNMGNSSSFGFEPDYNNQQNAEMPKCSSVIGSEMKNVLQRRKEQEFIDWNQGMRSQYSHFGGMAFNGNSHDEGFGRPARPSSSGSGCYNSYPSPSYDDLRLQPGKMLNSEVRRFFFIFFWEFL